MTSRCAAQRRLGGWGLEWWGPSVCRTQGGSHQVPLTAALDVLSVSLFSLSCKVLEGEKFCPDVFSVEHVAHLLSFLHFLQGHTF